MYVRLAHKNTFILPRWYAQPASNHSNKFLRASHEQLICLYKFYYVTLNICIFKVYRRLIELKPLWSLTCIVYRIDR